MNRVSLQHIAEEIGISRATVSLALRDFPEIAPATRQIVKETAERMNYIPNKLAGSLRSQQNRTIGIIVPTVGNSFFPELIEGIERAAKLAGYQCFICQSHSSTEMLAAEIDAMISHCVEGIILFPVNSYTKREIYQKLLKRSITTVLIGQVVDGVEAAYVGNDDVMAGRLAVDHLIDLKHKRIACLRGYPASSCAQERVKGYREALADAGIPEDEDLIVGEGFEFEDGQKAVETLLQRRVTFSAVFASTDGAAAGAMKALRAAGLRVPDDVSVVGCGNLNIASLITPSLTTIDQKPIEVGSTAMQTLLTLSGPNRKAESPPSILIQPTLIVRETTAVKK